MHIRRGWRMTLLSRVRYTGYCLLVMDSHPGWRRGARSTLKIRGLADDGTELDTITLVCN
jgi:hypothetical protein